MAWAGTGLVRSFVAGVPTSKLLADTTNSGKKKIVEDFSFVQISDSHIGFNKAANQNVTGTLKIAIDKINAGRAGMKQPEFMIHTATSPRAQSQPSSIQPSRSSRAKRRDRCFMFPESMIFPLTMANSTSSALAKGRWAMAGTATTTRGFTLWA